MRIEEIYNLYKEAIDIAKIPVTVHISSEGTLCFDTTEGREIGLELTKAECENLQCCTDAIEQSVSVMKKMGLQTVYSELLEVAIACEHYVEENFSSLKEAIFRKEIEAQKDIIIEAISNMKKAGAPSADINNFLNSLKTKSKQPEYTR